MAPLVTASVIYSILGNQLPHKWPMGCRSAGSCPFCERIERPLLAAFDHAPSSLERRQRKMPANYGGSPLWKRPPM